MSHKRWKCKEISSTCLYLSRYTLFFFSYFFRSFESVSVLFFPQRYVDSNRLAAVNMGSDLKSEMNTSRFAGAFSKDRKIGDPNDKFYIMQAEHMIKSGNSAMALHFVTQALEYNRENRVTPKKSALVHLYYVFSLHRMP